MRAMLIILATSLTLGVACTSGMLSSGDGGCTDADCGTIEDADTDGDGAISDPCDTINCPTGQECIEGRCQTVDRCSDVVCENPGEVCDPRDGACHSGAADEDADGYTIAAGDCDDSDASIHPGAAEPCDGIDNDCDREVDEGFPDADGDGFDTCGFGDSTQADCDDGNNRRYPGMSEVCDGLDNDCDSVTDEEQTPRTCSTECGTGEERCEGGEWVCSAPVECDCTPAGDTDVEDCGDCGRRTRTCTATLEWGPWEPCTGEGECSVGRSENRACGDCGTQYRTCDAGCEWGDWSTCGGEGPCGPGDTEACTTSCGSSGRRACSGTCEWGSCTPPGEICNGVDDDCDSLVDEGYRAEVVETTFTTLGTHHSPCDGTGERIGLDCNAAINRFCAARGCSTTGFGPVEWVDDRVWVVCVVATTYSITYTELATHHPLCDGVSQRFGRDCAAACHRYCQSRGFSTGFGPIENIGNSASVACVDGADAEYTTYTTLDGANPGCDGVTNMYGPYCNSAVHRHCRSTGRISGFGPVEATGDNVTLGCVIE